MQWRHTIAFIAALVLGGGLGCGDGGADTGPFSSIPIDRTIRGDGLSGPVDVVRDRYGIPHIYARTIEDAAFANGYVMASDRLAQMQIFRHFAKARIAEIFGADRDQIETDLEMRLHQMEALATRAWMELQASTDSVDEEMVRYLERFADGVNQYAADLQAGRYALDPAVQVLFDPTRFEPWTPVDSLAIGRLQAWSLSFDEAELERTRLFDEARAVFDEADPASAPDLARRAGAYFDLYPIRPMALVSTIDGFPNLDADGGTRAKPRTVSSTRRPRAPRELLLAALRTLRPKRLYGLEPRALDNGSNNWLVSPALAGGRALLANDPHLSLTNPPIWYLLHIVVPDAELDVEGASFPGIPGIVLGRNAHIAWGATVVAHDVTDYYLETIVPCDGGAGDCVLWKGQKVPIQRREETIRVGALGTIIPEQERKVVYEIVPHHGPIVPVIENYDVVPRTSNQAISIRFTGYDVTHEVRAIYRLARARSVDEAFAALEHFAYGGQNFVIADDQGNIGWTTQSRVPLRTDGCFGLHPRTNPRGVAPYLVVPGDGSCEWDGWLDSRYLPHAVNPARGFLATANQDPVGETFDGDALNGPVVDGRRLYLGADYDSGFREARITERLQALADSGETITADDMAAIQADVRSSYGHAMRPHLLAAFAQVAAGTAPADAQAFWAALPPERRARLEEARARIESWSLDTPPAVLGSPTEAEIADSVATTIFNAWAVFFLDKALGDELERIGGRVETQATARAALALFERPGDLLTGVDSTTGQPVLCDDLSTSPAVESCTHVALAALDEALAWAESAAGFGTSAMEEWRWGRKHTLTLRPLTPVAELEIPPADDPEPLLRSGYPRTGDNFSVDAQAPGLSDLDFSFNHGPSFRHVTELPVGGPLRTRFALPGGQSHDRSSPHYRDLMDRYWFQNAYFDFPFPVAEILAVAESRWRFE